MKTRVKHAIRRALLPLGLRLGAFRQHAPRPMPRVAHPPVDADEPLPSIRIVTPSLDQGCFIEGAIRSVLDQGYPRLEYVVCDGGSRDGSVDVLRRWADRLTDWRSEPDGGQAAAINTGFGRCRGEIMAWLNADDRLLPGALLRVGRYFRDHPEVDAVYGHRLVLDGDGMIVGRWVLPPHGPGAFRWRDYVPQETLFWRSSLWERAGGQIEESLHFAIDWDLLLRFEAAGARFVRLPCYLGGFTTHPEQKSLASRDALGRPEFERLQQHVASTAARRAIERARSALYMLEAAAWDLAYRLRGHPLLAAQQCGPGPAPPHGTEGGPDHT